MPGLLDWWYRIRRVVSPPGAPSTRAGVPSDAEAARAAELAVVFAHADAVAPELGAIEQRAADMVERVRADAEAQLERIAADARTRAALARADAAASLHDRHERAAHALTQQAAGQAAAVREVAQESFPALVDLAVTMVRDYALDRDGGGSGLPKGG